MRLTYTEIEEKSRPILTSEPPFNTITVFPALVNDAAKFIELMRAIVGSNFLRIPLE